MKPFSDPYRGDGVFKSFDGWLFAIRRRWHFYAIHLPGRRGYFRVYIGPFEIEKRPTEKQARQALDTIRQRAGLEE